MDDNLSNGSGGEEKLSPEARVIYDQLRAEAELPERNLADEQAATRVVIADARRALAEGGECSSAASP